MEGIVDWASPLSIYIHLGCRAQGVLGRDRVSQQHVQSALEVRLAKGDSIKVGGPSRNILAGQFRTVVRAIKLD